MSAIEAAGVLTGILSVYLLARERIWGWLVGVVNAVLFMVVFYRAKLYADASLQVVYVGLCLYGWRAWRAGGQGTPLIAPSHAVPRTLAAALVLGAVSSLAIGATMARYTDASLPWVDASTTSFSLVAQWMQTRKWIQNWWLWMVIDVVYVAVYLVTDLYLTAGLYLVFCGLAWVGLVEWRKSLRRVEPNLASSY